MDDRVRVGHEREGLIGTRQQAILGLDDESEEVRPDERQGVRV